jgi:hypothetical protein
MTELKRDTIIMDNRSADRIKLRDQITQLPIENPLSLDEFLSPEEETIVNKDEDILTSVINHYLGKEEELSNKKEVKKVDTTKALKAVKTVKIRKL